MEGGHVHKAGPMKQRNKAFKTSGGHASKGQLRRAQKGKVSVGKTNATRSMASEGRAARRRASAAMGAKKKAELLFSKKLGSSGGPPRIVGLVSLSATADANAALSMLLGGAVPVAGPNTIIYPELKQRITYFAVAREIDAVLDIAKTADLILFVFSPEGVDMLGETFISLIKAQGLPAVISVVQGLPAGLKKNLADAKQNLKAFLEFHFPDSSRLLSLDTLEDAGQVVRFLTNTRVKEISWREGRPYLLMDSCTYTPTEETRGTLSVLGYLRGGQLTADDLMYIPDLGDYQIDKIYAAAEPVPFPREARNMEQGEFQEKVISEPTAKQDSLVSEANPDVMTNEQNWGPQDDADLAAQEKKRSKKVPRGTSDYQSAWIFESSDEEDGNDSFDDEDEDEMNDEKPNEGEEEEGEEEESMTTTKTTSTSTTPTKKIQGEQTEARMEGAPDEPTFLEPAMADDEEDEEDDDVDLHTESAFDTAADLKEKQRLREANKDDIEFEDEVEVPHNEKAKVRFQKYRGLKSFRLSPWDVKENLPLDYGRIFQFQSFNRTCKKTKAERDGIAVGTYVRVEILNVPVTINQYSKQRPLIFSGLFKHEHKISVINVTVARHPAFTPVLRSKEEVVIQCGFRRFTTSPIYSQYTHGTDKHKCERFLHPNRTSVATFYGPVTYPSVPVLVFKQYPNADQEALGAVGGMVQRVDLSSPNPTAVNEWCALVGTGSLLSVDPDRLAIRRIILTGHTYKVHKRSAVIRYMFQFIDDIRWFKPVELWTKYGRKGHIREPLGTHGLMKCSFDRPLQNHDTVCMSLYKRAFPKWGHLRTVYGVPLMSPVVETDEPTTLGDASGTSTTGAPRLTAEALAAFNMQN